MDKIALIYKDAIEMAFNLKDSQLLNATVDYDKDTWNVEIKEEDGIYNMEIEGFFIRSCFKWLLKGGKKGWNQMI